MHWVCKTHFLLKWRGCELMKASIEAQSESLAKRSPISLRIFFHALITFIAVEYQLELNPMISYWGLQGLHAVRWNLTQSFESLSFVDFIIFSGLCLLYLAISRVWNRDGEKTWQAKAGNAGRRLGLTIHIPSALFAAMMVLGWSFSQYNAVGQVLTLQHGQLIKSLFVFWGYDLLFRYLIQFVYLKFALGFPRLSAFRPKKPKVLLWYEKKLVSKPFHTVALTLLILYLPLMIVSYPGLITSDTVGQTIIGFPELVQSEETGNAGQLIKPGSHLNNHHPVAHTMLLHCCLVAGNKILHSWNAGYYLYSVLQELAFICVIAFLIREYIQKNGVSTWYAVCVLIYVFASPLIHNYVIQNTKDVFYALFLLLTIHFWYHMIKDGGRRNLFLLLVSATGTVIFRNEGQYVLMLAAAGSVCLNRTVRKQFAIVLLYLLAFSVGYFHLLFPALGITPGSRREMLSIPFQQTARYIVEHGDQVTYEEREAIDAVLDYWQISEAYDPNTADPVKDLYRDPEVTSKALIRYLICWIKMGIKQPKTYLSAFLNNKYEYFYPDHGHLWPVDYKRTGFLFAWITELSEAVGIAPSQPALLNGLRNYADDTQTWLSEFSPLSVFMITSLYPSFVILLLCYSIRKRDRIMISMTLIPFIVLLVCLTGPTNGNYSRYTFPLALIWPFFDPIVRPVHASRQAGSP